MSEETSVVSEGKVVFMHYTLTDDNGETIDSSRDGDPLFYLHGVGQIVPGLEKEMDGKEVGDAFQVEVAPADGYGEHDGSPLQEIDRDHFPPDVELQPGMVFAAEAQDGAQRPFWVAKVEDGKVFVDNNHPLSGKTLHFDVEVTKIRDATDEEIAHGHAHGPTGHEGH